jgi:hypothetical protein
MQRSDEFGRAAHRAAISRRKERQAQIIEKAWFARKDCFAFPSFFFGFASSGFWICFPGFCIPSARHPAGPRVSLRVMFALGLSAMVDSLLAAALFHNHYF